MKTLLEIMGLIVFALIVWFSVSVCWDQKKDTAFESFGKRAAELSAKDNKAVRKLEWCLSDLRAQLNIAEINMCSDCFKDYQDNLQQLSD